MGHEIYVDKQFKSVDKGQLTPAEEKEMAANKFVDDIYQCGCGMAPKEKDPGVDKESWANKQVWIDDREPYPAAKKLSKGDKKSVGDEDFTVYGKDSGNMKPLADGKFVPGDKWECSGEKESDFGGDKFFKKPGVGDKDFSIDKEAALKDFDTKLAEKGSKIEKPTMCDLGDKVSPAEYAEFIRELKRQEQLSEKISQVLHAGKFGDSETRAAIADNFGVLAQNGGREGEQQLLNKMNAGLKADGSEYRLRFGQNIIKTPGGRHLEIMNDSGRVTDSMDFVVPNFVGRKDSSFVNIKGQLNPAKEKAGDVNVTKEQPEWNK